MLFQEDLGEISKCSIIYIHVHICVFVQEDLERDTLNHLIATFGEWGCIKVSTVAKSPGRALICAEHCSLVMEESSSGEWVKLA